MPPSFLACTAYSMESAEYISKLAHCNGRLFLIFVLV